MVNVWKLPREDSMERRLAERVVKCCGAGSCRVGGIVVKGTLMVEVMIIGASTIVEATMMTVEVTMLEAMVVKAAAICVDTMHKDDDKRRPD